MFDLNLAWQGLLNGAWATVMVFAVVLFAFCGVLSLLAACGGNTTKADKASPVSERWDRTMLPLGF